MGDFLMSSYGKYSDKRLYWSREENTPKLFMNSKRVIIMMYKDNNYKLPLLQLRRRLVISVLKMHGTQSSQGRSAAPTLPGARYDMKD